MPKKLRAGVIGVGTFGSQHARIYAELDSVDLVAVSDLKTDRLDDITRRYNVDSSCPDVMYAPEIGGHYTGILRDEINHFVECVMYDRKPAVSGQDGKQAVAVVCAIAESLKTKQPIYL